MRNVKLYDDYVKEAYLEAMLLYGSVFFLALFFGKLLRKIHNRKYRKVIAEEIIPNLKNGKVGINRGENLIILYTDNWEIKINKLKKTVRFLNKKRGQMYQPIYNKTTDTSFKSYGLHMSISFPLDLNDEEFEELVQILEK